MERHILQKKNTFSQLFCIKPKSKELVRLFFQDQLCDAFINNDMWKRKWNCLNELGNKLVSLYYMQNGVFLVCHQSKLVSLSLIWIHMRAYQGVRNVSLEKFAYLLNGWWPSISEAPVYVVIKAYVCDLNIK